MRTRRQILIAAGTSLTLMRPWSAIAQAPIGSSKQVRIGTFTAGASGAGYRTFVETLRDLGWVEGRNVIYEHAVRTGNDGNRLPDIARALVGKEPDLIYVNTFVEIEVVLAATRTIPVVTSSLVVETGIVKDLSRPGGNLTGIATLGAETAGKRMEIAKELMPQLRRAGFLMTSSVASAEELKAVEAKAGPNVKMISAVANNIAELEAAFNVLAESQIEALMLAQVGWTQGSKARKLIIDFALKSRIPLIAHRSVLTDDGALMSYEDSRIGQHRRAAYLADSNR